MTVVWTRSADRDLAEIYNFFEPRSTQAVRTVLRETPLPGRDPVTTGYVVEFFSFQT